MKIVVLAQFAGSIHHGMVFGHYYLAKEWVSAGYDVTIVAARFAHTRQVQPQEGVTEEWIDGIRYVWLNTPVYDANDKVGRVRSMLSYTVRTWWSFPQQEADVIICSSHHPFAIHSAKKWAKKRSAKLIFEVRDLWPLTLIQLGGASPKNPFIQLMQWSEDVAYRVADHTVSVLNNAFDYMQQHGLERARYHVIPNSIQLDASEQSMPLPDAQAAQLTALTARCDFVVGYAGRVGLANALEPLVDAVRILADDDIHVGMVVLGDGSHADSLKQHAIDQGIHEQCAFLGSVAKAQVADCLAQLDAAYIGLQSHPLFHYGVSPTKINDYMLAAKPIVCAIDSPNNDVEQAQCGIQCVPENPSTVANAIRELRAMSEQERIAMGQAGKDWLIKHKSYTRLAAQFAELFE
ncbi:MAG: glycosyltransferase family 4 protein [Pseudomonadota bacterium]